jgi:hypothetical protein
MDYPKRGFSCFPPRKLMPPQLPSISFPIHHSLIILSFDAVLPEVLTTSLNSKGKKVKGTVGPVLD